MLLIEAMAPDCFNIFIKSIAPKIIARVSRALKNPAIVRAPISRTPIFQTRPATSQATAHDTGSARLAGQLNPTMNTTVSKIGSAATNAYILIPPLEVVPFLTFF